MKKKVFLGTLAAMIFSIHISAFAAPAAAFGDVSAGNHIAAPYAKSDIIVPRPSASKYAALQKYAYIGIPADVKGHWAEKYCRQAVWMGVQWHFIPMNRLLMLTLLR